MRVDEFGRRHTKVLLVDDDPAVLRLMTLTLRLSGYDVCVAEDGRKALDGLRECSPDVIVLDMQMPVMDGPTFYRRLRAEGWTVPVLVVSAVGRADVLAGVEAQGFLAKPFLPDQLVTQVEKLAA